LRRGERGSRRSKHGDRWGVLQRRGKFKLKCRVLGGQFFVCLRDSGGSVGGLLYKVEVEFQHQCKGGPIPRHHLRFGLHCVWDSGRIEGDPKHKKGEVKYREFVGFGLRVEV
jgi:hypothetical protein